MAVKLGYIDLLDSIDSMRAITIVNAYLLNFFDKYLKNKPSPLLDSDEKLFTEVEKKKS